MKAFFIVLLLLVVGTIALGFYQGWWTASSDKEDEQPNVEFKMNKEKIKQDKDTVKQKVQDIGKAQEETGEPTDKDIDKDTDESTDPVKAQAPRS